MAWSNSSKDSLREAMEYVDNTVTDYRNRGLTREKAREQAALTLAITPRRARSLFYQEAFSMAVEEYRRIKAAYLRHLDDEADSLALRSQAARKRRAQLELDL